MKGCGCPERCKNIFLEAVDGYARTGYTDEDGKWISTLSKEEEEWIKEHKGIELKDFTYGISIPGKLRPKTVPGGIILEKTYFTIR